MSRVVYYNNGIVFSKYNVGYGELYQLQSI